MSRLLTPLAQRMILSLRGYEGSYNQAYGSLPEWKRRIITNIIADAPANGRSKENKTYNAVHGIVGEHALFLRLMANNVNLDELIKRSITFADWACSIDKHIINCEVKKQSGNYPGQVVFTRDKRDEGWYRNRANVGLMLTWTFFNHQEIVKPTYLIDMAVFDVLPLNGLDNKEVGFWVDLNKAISLGLTVAL